MNSWGDAEQTTALLLLQTYSDFTDPFGNASFAHTEHANNNSLQTLSLFLQASAAFI